MPLVMIFFFLSRIRNCIFARQEFVSRPGTNPCWMVGSSLAEPGLHTPSAELTVLQIMCVE